MGFRNNQHKQFGLHHGVELFYRFHALYDVMKYIRLNSAMCIQVDASNSSYQNLEAFAYQSVLNQPASYVRFETAQFNLAIQSGMHGLFNFMNRLLSENITIGDDYTIQIKSIEKIHNPRLGMEYQMRRMQISSHVSRHGGVNQLVKLRTHELGGDCDVLLNETILFHGINPKFLDSILHKGLDPVYCTANKITGFGPLGKGVYLTDSFSKAVLYSKCSKCFKDKCACVMPDGTSPERALLACMVTLGDIFHQPYKERHRYFNDQIPCNRHAVVAPDNQTDPNSPFSHTEIAINHKAQIRPLYIIRYQIGLNAKHFGPDHKIVNDEQFDTFSYLSQMEHRKLSDLYAQLKQISHISIKTTQSQLKKILHVIPNEIKLLIIDKDRIVRINQRCVKDLLHEINMILHIRQGIQNRHSIARGHLFFHRHREHTEFGMRRTMFKMPQRQTN
jgi:hypothetical protein